MQETAGRVGFDADEPLQSGDGAAECAARVGTAAGRAEGPLLDRRGPTRGAEPPGVRVASTARGGRLSPAACALLAGRPAAAERGGDAPATQEQT